MSEHSAPDSGTANGPPDSRSVCTAIAEKREPDLSAATEVETHRRRPDEMLEEPAPLPMVPQRLRPRPGPTNRRSR